MGVMLLFAAVAELTSMVSVVQAAKGSGREAGDFGLDPLEFCGNPDTKKFMLEAETTHARLAMLAAVGWPASELWDQKLADTFGIDSALTSKLEAPSVLNLSLIHI